MTYLKCNKSPKNVVQGVKSAQISGNNEATIFKQTYEYF